MEPEIQTVKKIPESHLDLVNGPRVAALTTPLVAYLHRELDVTHVPAAFEAAPVPATTY